MKNMIGQVSYYYEDREFNEYVNNNLNAIDDIDDSQSLFSFSSDNKENKTRRLIN